MKKISSLVIITFLLITVAPTLKAQVNIQDSLVLVNIFDSLGGKHWGGAKWLTKASVSSWFGVRVNANNRVDSIAVNGVRGVLPLTIGNLTALRYLNFGSGNISGTIPSSIGNLTNLHLLNLNNNQFTGSIPASIGNLTKLDTLYLQYNQLSDSIPSSLGNLTNLKILHLENNKLSGSLPSTLGNLVNLLELELYYNQFSGSIPSSYGNLTSLTDWGLFGTQVSGNIPSSLGNLTNIQQLFLYNNRLTGTIPASLGNLTNLAGLGLNGNQLSGTIPTSLQNLTNLTEGYLGNNQFTFAGMEAIAKNSAFANVSDGYAPQAIVPLHQNNTDTTLSVSVGGTPANDTYKWYKDGKLVATKVADSTFKPTSNGNYWVVATNSVATELTLYSDTITINYPVNIQDSLVLVNLYDSTGGSHWNIHKNWLTKAPVSTWWGIGVDSNNRVDSIELSATGLKGILPYSLGSLSNLKYLDLGGNSLTGLIPASFANLNNLVSFSLSWDYGISGSIPSYLSNFANLVSIALDNNQLTGAIPPSFGNLTNLIALTLNNNQLTGTIPASLGNLTKLTDLELYSNQLTGSIPASFDSLSNLVYFILNGNQLSGTIPPLTNLTNLYEGVVAYNKFTFAGMEAIAQNAAYTVDGIRGYSSQATVPLIQNNTDTTLSVSVGGTPTNDTYKWYNSGKLIATIKSDSTFRPTSNGQYYVAATNAIATELTLYSDTININYPTNPQDSLALVDLYNSTGGKNWVNHTNWLTAAPVNTWYGVTTYNWRVTGIALDSNNLNGAIPSSLNSLPYLSSLNLSNNQLNFSALEGVAKQYSFALYTPQAIVPLQQNGDTLSVSVGGTPSNNTFKWYRNDTLVATITSDSTFSFTTIGRYRVVATNAVATELTLYSDTITIAGLPIKDITLSAKETNGQVLLQWQTIGEVNTASFTIQRSTDGKTFTDLTTKKAVGNGDNGYSYMDVSAASRVNYYRIKVTDKDGATTYSKVVSASLTINASPLTIYPNPAKDKVTISGSHIATVKVIDNMGRVVKVITLKDATNPTISVSSLPVGIYHLRIITSDGNVSGVGFVKE